MRIGWRGVIAAAAVVGVAGPAGAAPSPFGATGRIVDYNVSAAAVPMSLGDVNAPSSQAATMADGTHVAYTEATTETGGRSRALASPVWAVSPESDSARRVGVPSASSVVAARAAHPGGPDRSATRVPGGPAVSASANGLNAVASASASMATVAGFAVAEELAGSSQSSKDDVDGAVGRGVASVGRAQILGNLVSMEGVITRVRVVSKGARAVVEGTTTVNKVVVAGIPASLTTHGLVGLPQPVSTGLAKMGISVSLIEPVDTIEGAGGSRSVGGVFVRYDSKIGRTALEDRQIDGRIVSWLPENWEEIAKRLMALDSDVTLRFGQVAVQAAATPAHAATPAVGVSGGDSVAGLAPEPSDDVLEPPTFYTVNGEEFASSSPLRFANVVGGVGIPGILIALAFFTAVAFAIPLARLAEEAAEAPVAARRR